MTDYTLTAENVTRTFGRRLVFKNVNFSFEKPGIYGIAGKNGSGKSTLVKIIAGIISPTSGKIIHRKNGFEIGAEKIHEIIGFVSPYLMMYDEFTAWENLELLSKIEGAEFNTERAEMLLDLFGLLNRKNDRFGGYSSGMKQRVKFVYSVLYNPPLLILDEPTSNLDNDGKEKLYKLVKDDCRKSVVLIASNEESDLALCESTIMIEDFKQ